MFHAQNELFIVKFTIKNLSHETSHADKLSHRGMIIYGKFNPDKSGQVMNRKI